MGLQSAGVLAGFCLALLPACAGGTFHLDSSLSKTPELPVSGELGFNAVYCPDSKAEQASPSGESWQVRRANYQQEEEKKKQKAPGLAGDKSAGVVVGSLTGLASAPHRHLDSVLLFDEAVLRDYERFLRSVHDDASLRDVRVALTGLTGSGDTRHFPAPVEMLLHDIHGVLRLPRTTTETMTFTVFGRRDGRTIAAACISTDTVRLIGYFDPPHFALACRIVPAVDGVARDLGVSGYGTWANARFAGRLGSSAGERATFSSRNVTVLGMGGVRGFDLRSPGALQVAAISFFQVRGRNGRTEPRAWAAAVPSTGWGDALLTTLAIAYVFPWPSSCDTEHIREQGVERALDAP